MTTIKKKRSLSLEEKMRILEVFDEKSQTKRGYQTQLAAELQLPASTLRSILKNREEIKQKYKLGGVQRKKLKPGKFDNLEKILVEWFRQAKALELPINGPIICEKAREIANTLQITDFHASTGWIDRFKNRHGIVYHQYSKRAEIMAEQLQFVDVVLEEEDPAVLEDFSGHSLTDVMVPPSEMGKPEETLNDEHKDENSSPLLSTVQALSAIKDLKRYVSSLDESEESLQNLMDVENFISKKSCKQLEPNQINDS